MKIDIHAHVVDRKYIDALEKDLSLSSETTQSGQTLLRRNGYTFMWHREAMFDIDARLRTMDQQGIDMRVLSLSTPNVYEWRGAKQVEMARYMNDVTAAAARLIYAGIFERYPNFPYIMAHTGGALLMVLERLDNGYRLFPDCRKHISRLPSEYATRLYYDTCSFFGPALKMAHEVVGVDHLLWGSDDPFIGADSAHVDKLPISEMDRNKILGGNAARLLKLKVAA